MAFSTFNTFSSCNANMNWNTQPSNGGTMTYNGQYYIHTFTTSGNLTVYHDTDVI